MAACSRCGSLPPPEARFCPRCGARQPLDEVAFSEERKTVTVLFCDLVGFTARSDGSDPEDVRARLLPFHHRVRREIERLGGTVEKFIGDAVMAVFGAPVTREDDAELAVRTGLRLLDAVGDLNRADAGLGLRVRIGIETGEAVVSLDARPETGDTLVIGDVVNTAARLQAAAPEGALVIGVGTYRSVYDLFDLAPLEAAVVKGKAAPVARWQVNRALSPRVVGIARDHTIPFVGRDLELNLLRGIFDRAVRDKSLQLVTVCGEPGAGKSRLVGELALLIDDAAEATRWLQGHCLPYSEAAPFSALAEIVKAHAGILDSDHQERVEAKLAEVVYAALDRDWQLSRLRPLVGLDAGAPVGQDEAFAAWRSFCQSVAVDAPAVLVFEDLHWADARMVDFLEHLVEWSADVSILVVCTTRPELYESHRGWAVGRRNATTINLPPQSTDETDLLVRNLLGVEGLTPDRLRPAVELSGGNPLYAEQFVRAMRATGPDGTRERTSHEIPGSVRALVAARLDTLPPARKALLQDAAVIGHVFWSGAVTSLAQRPAAEVTADLRLLASKELVRVHRRSSEVGEDEYSFWHAVVRDVCYAQIPRVPRATRHRRVAAWIERRADGRADGSAEVLAHHYVEALKLEEAAGASSDVETRHQARRFLTAAGDHVLTLDTTKAIALYGEALALTLAEDPERPHLLERCGRAASYAGLATEAEAAYRDALAIHRSAGASKDAGRVLVLLADSLDQRLDPRRFDVTAEARSVLENVPPGPDLVDAYVQTAVIRRSVNDRAGARRWVDRAITLAHDLGVRPPGRALTIRGVLRLDAGDPGARDDLDEAVERAEANGDFTGAALWTMNILVVDHLYQGPRAALRRMTEMAESCARRGLHHAELVVRATALDVALTAGEWVRAEQDGRALMRRLRRGGDSYVLLGTRSAVARARALRGREVDRNEILGLVGRARRSGDAQVLIHVLQSAGVALAQNDDAAGAVALVRELVGTPGIEQDLTFGPAVPDLVRIAVRGGAIPLADRVLAMTTPRSPLHEHAVATGRAVLAEARGEPGADLAYTDVAERWARFGAAGERAYALAGATRCTSDPERLAAIGTELREAVLRLGTTALTTPTTVSERLLAGNGRRFDHDRPAVPRLDQ